MIIMSQHDCILPDFLTQSDIFTQCKIRPCVECSFEIYVCHRYAMPQDCKLAIKPIELDDSSKVSQFLFKVDAGFNINDYKGCIGFAIVVDNSFVGILYLSDVTVKIHVCTFAFINTPVECKL